ncbi:MAG TPA: ribonuclease J, partial [Anaerolineae bacterium]|nr:ribonuclease J [Anaerolineae bacterium]
SYLVERRDIVRGIIITHGHEDHHGALPYVLPHVQAPVYATRLTRGLIEVKLKENRLLERAQLRTIDLDKTLTLGPFHLEFFHVCHSVPDAVGLAIDTPVGLVVHTGDYKFDYTPVDGRLTDFHKLADFGSRGVLVLLADSTNADRPRYTPSEQEVSDSFDRIFAQAEGRIIVATFASNISRVQQVMDTAVQYGRRVGVVGRSMVDNVRMAQELGYLSVPDGTLVRTDELSKLPPEKVTIVCTGTQGEPTSALVRMANREHRQVRIQPGDTVILSATPIPGNEELVHRTLNNLFRLGAWVYYQDLLPVHVSGHASQEEQKLMISLTRPKFFVPIQGEYRHLVLHAELARQMGIPRENIFVVESGQVLEFDERSGRVAETLDGGYVFVDGLGVGDVGTVVLRDRHLLSQDGFFIAVVAVDKSTGKLVEGPDIISRGFVYLRDSEELLEEAKQQVIKALRKRGRSTALDDKIKEVLSRFLYERTKRRPMILPVVMEV